MDTAPVIERTRPIEVGDILEQSGGYNCTETHFAIVESFNKSGKKAILRGIGKYQIDGDWMNGRVGPRPDMKTSATFEAKVVNGGWRSFCRGRMPYSNGQSGSLQNYYLWDGKPIWNNCD